MNLRILLLLGAMAAFGPLAIDMYLPSFTVLADSLSTDIEHVQFSLASYFMGLAIGQLIYGPLIDRYGRRQPILIGIGIFALTSAACALASSLEALVGLRFLQALGGCAGMVASRAVVRDLCSPLQSARVFSELMLVMGSAPILAPILGGFLLTLAGWQSIFVCLAIFAALVWGMVWRFLPETRPTDLPVLSFRAAWAQYGRLLKDRSFVLYALIGSVAMGGMFAYISGSPYVFMELYQVPADHYSWLFGANAAGFIVAGQLNALFLKRSAGPGVWLRHWIRLYALAGTMLLLVAMLQGSLWMLLPPLFLSIASLGGIMPNATACALAEHRENAGSASALLGAFQFALATGTATLVGLAQNGTAVPLALAIALCAGAGWRLLQASDRQQQAELSAL